MSINNNDVIEYYLAFLRASGYTIQSVKTREYQLLRLAKYFTLCNIDEKTLYTWLAKQNWALETRKSFTACMHGFYDWAYKHGYTNSDISLCLPKVRGGVVCPKPCPDDFIIEALKIATPLEVLMLRLGAECGLRRAEIAQVHSSDITKDLLGYSLLVHGKGNKERYVPISDDLAEDILECNGYVFVGRFGGHCEVSFIGKHLARILPRGFSAHSLRHRYATVAYEKSSDIFIVSKLLGHTNINTTQRYIALGCKQLHDVASLCRIS